MGTYATTTSISEALPGYLASNTTTMDAAGTNKYSRHIDDAEAEINSVLASRYSLPFTTVPPLCRSLALHMANYYAIRDGFTVEGLSRNQYLDDYKHSMDILNDLRDGKRKLTATNGSLISVNTSGRIISSTLNYTPIFGRDEQSKWTRDDDEVTDQENARA